MIRHSDSGVDFEGTYRSSVYSEPPAQSGSVGSGSLGSPGIEADDQRDFTFAWRIRVSAIATESSNPNKPSGGSGMYCLMSCSAQITSVFRLSTSGRAMFFGTGVTKPIQRADRPGESKLIGKIIRLRSPATFA